MFKRFFKALFGFKSSPDTCLINFGFSGCAAMFFLIYATVHLFAGNFLAVLCFTALTGMEIFFMKIWAKRMDVFDKKEKEKINTRLWS